MRARKTRPTMSACRAQASGTKYEGLRDREVAAGPERANARNFCKCLTGDAHGQHRPPTRCFGTGREDRPCASGRTTSDPSRRSKTQHPGLRLACGPEVASNRSRKAGSGTFSSEVHSALRDIDGLHCSGCTLDEICSLIYAKLFDEGTERPETGELFFQRWRYKSVEECAAEIRRLFLQAVDDDRRSSHRDSRPVNARAASPRANCSSRAAGPSRSRRRALSGTTTLLHRPWTSRRYASGERPSSRPFASGHGGSTSPREVNGLSVVSVMQPTFASSSSIHSRFRSPSHLGTSRPRSAQARQDDAVPRGLCGSRAPHGIEKSDRMVRVAMTDLCGFMVTGTADICMQSICCRCALQLAFDLIARPSISSQEPNPPFGVDLFRDKVSLQLGVSELCHRAPFDGFGWRSSQRWKKTVFSCWRPAAALARRSARMACSAIAATAVPCARLGRATSACPCHLPLPNRDVSPLGPASNQHPCCWRKREPRRTGDG